MLHAACRNQVRPSRLIEITGRQNIFHICTVGHIIAI